MSACSYSSFALAIEKKFIVDTLPVYGSLDRRAATIPGAFRNEQNIPSVICKRRGRRPLQNDD